MPVGESYLFGKVCGASVRGTFGLINSDEEDEEQKDALSKVGDVLGDVVEVVLTVKMAVFTADIPGVMALVADKVNKYSTPKKPSPKK